MSDRARMTSRSYGQGRSGKYDALAHVCCSDMVRGAVTQLCGRVNQRSCARIVRAEAVEAWCVASTFDKLRMRRL